YLPRHRPDRYSFPTRRSSDLDTIAGTFTHPTGSDVVSGRIRWGADRAFRPNSLVNGTALPLRVLAHRQVVGMFVDVHVRHRQTVPVDDPVIERHPVLRARQVLADDPHSRRVD